MDLDMHASKDFVIDEFMASDSNKDGKLNYQEFKVAYARAHGRSEKLAEQRKDILFARFHDADKGGDGKDELLNFQDWKADVMKVFSEAVESDMVIDFGNSDLNKDKVLSFYEFKLSVAMTEKRANIAEKLKDPIFAIFYSFDKSGNNEKSEFKKEALTLDFWKTGAKSLDPYVTDEVLEQEFKDASPSEDTPPTLDFQKFKKLWPKAISRG